MSQFVFPPLVASLDSEASSGAALPSAQMIVGGFYSTGSVVYPLAVDADGQLQVDVVSSMPLPSGAATSLLQTAGNNILTTIDVDTSALFNCVDAGGSQMQVDIVADGAGLATSALQGSANTLLTTISTKDFATQTTLALMDADTSILSAAVATIQDAQGATDTGIPALVVRNDTLADLSGADGDYAPIQVNATGAVYTVLSAGTAAFGKLSANSGVDIGDVDVLSMPAITVNSIAPVDFLDGGVVDTSLTNIPAAGSAILVADLGAACTQLEVVDDIGEYMSLYTEPGGSTPGYTLKTYLPLGGGRVKVSLASGVKIKLYSETGTTISSGKIAINFLG